MEVLHSNTSVSTVRCRPLLFHSQGSKVVMVPSIKRANFYGTKDLAIRKSHFSEKLS